jgi:hypothetical protein
VVDVVDEPDRHAAAGGALERPDYERPRLVAEPEVVERELERPLGGVEEAGDVAGDVERALPAVGQRADVDQACC